MDIEEAARLSASDTQRILQRMDEHDEGDHTKLILQRMDAQDRKLNEIAELTSQTNGRVRTLELWKARMDGTKAAFSWVVPVASALAGSAIGTLVILLVTSGGGGTH